MPLDKDYLKRLAAFFYKNQGKTYTVKELSNDPIKFVLHIKHYIDTRHSRKEYVDVSFNNEYTKIKIQNKL